MRNFLSVELYFIKRCIRVIFLTRQLFINFTALFSIIKNQWKGFYGHLNENFLLKRNVSNETNILTRVLLSGEKLNSFKLNKIKIFFVDKKG